MKTVNQKINDFIVKEVHRLEKKDAERIKSIIEAIENSRKEL